MSVVRMAVRATVMRTGTRTRMRMGRMKRRTTWSRMVMTRVRTYNVPINNY